MASYQPTNTAPVLIAVDLQQHSSETLKQGFALARKRNTQAIVLHVVHETVETAGFYRSHASRMSTLPMEDIAESMLRDLLNSELERLPAADRPSKIGHKLVHGVPGLRIAEVAEQLDACCIVLGCTGCTGLARLWRGSVEDSLRKHTQRELFMVEATTPSLHEPVTSPAAHIPQSAH